MVVVWKKMAAVLLGRWMIAPSQDLEDKGNSQLNREGLSSEGDSVAMF